jgi:DNA-binding NarL/FixJ family response regulator
VLVADDHAVVRSGLKQLLEEQAGIEVCCEATTGVEAVESVKKNKAGHDLAGFDHAGHERP